ncbi:Uncharacterised protein [Mycobacteroides abscessus subsp. abscessus]|nr:Uncharacterised protein [Mycobacteroides abscessus subsp. abscessus]
MTRSQIPAMYAARQPQTPALRFAFPSTRLHVLCEELMTHLRFRDSWDRMMKDTWHHITKTDVKATARPVSMVLAMPAQRQTLAVVHPQVHSAPQAQRPQSA